MFQKKGFEFFTLLWVYFNNIVQPFKINLLHLMLQACRLVLRFTFLVTSYKGKLQNLSFYFLFFFVDCRQCSHTKLNQIQNSQDFKSTA